jgi:hypothetical protein
MGFLVRAINRAKWDPKPEELGPDLIQADAVTIDLKTTGNCLSFWRCIAANEAELKDIAFAVAVKRESLEKMDLAWLEEDNIQSIEIVMNNTIGDTYVEDMRDKHINAEKLDLEKIYLLSKRLCVSIRDENRFKRYTRGEIIQIVRDGISQGRFSIDLIENIKAKDSFRKVLGIMT